MSALGRVMLALEEAGYEPRLVGKGPRVSVYAGEMLDGEYPEADEALEEIRALLPDGWSADWTGDGNADDLDVWIEAG